MLTSGYGRVQSVKLLSRAAASPVGKEAPSEGICAAVAFMDIKSASKAHNSEHKLDERALTTEYYEPAAIPSSAGSSPAGSGYSGSSGGSATSSRFPPGHSVPEEHPVGFERPFYDRTPRTESEPYIRRPNNYHVTPDGLRVRTRERLFNRASPYSSNIERPVTLNHPRVPGAWFDGSTTPSSSRATYVAVASAVVTPDASYEIPERRSDGEKSIKKKNKSRSGSESPSGSMSSRSRSPSPSSRSSSRSASSSHSNKSSSPGSGSEKLETGTRTRGLQSAVSAPVVASGPAIVRTADNQPLAVTVKNLPYRSSDTSLKDGLYHEYKKHGKVTWVKVVGHDYNRYGLVCFKKPEDVTKAIEISHNKQFFGCKIEVAAYEGYDVEDNEFRPYEAELDEYHPKATRTLFIGNLEKDVTASELRKKFEPFGEIIEIDIKKQGAVSSYAFCQYSDIISVVKAMRTMDGEHLGNNRIKLGFGKSMPTNCVWIDGAGEMSEKSLSAQCSVFGTITQLAIDRDRGHALVFYEQIQFAQNAVKEMRGASARGRKFQVDFASRECQESFYEKSETNHPMDRIVYPIDCVRDGSGSTKFFDTPVVCPTQRFPRYETPSRSRASSYSRSINPVGAPGPVIISPAVPSLTGTPRQVTRARLVRYTSEYFEGPESCFSPDDKANRNFDEITSQGSDISGDVCDYETYITRYGYPRGESPARSVTTESSDTIRRLRTDKLLSPGIEDEYKNRSLQSVVISADLQTGRPTFQPPDIRHLQKERVHLLEQLEECPSSGDEVVSPKKRLKLDMGPVDSSVQTNILSDLNCDVIVNHNSENLNNIMHHRKSLEVRRLSENSIKHMHCNSRRPSIDSTNRLMVSRDLSQDHGVGVYTPHTICKRRKTGSSVSEGEHSSRGRGHALHSHHSHEASGGESADGSRPGTPLCDERPENINLNIPRPTEPRRMPRDRSNDGPLSLPLPRFAAQVLHQTRMNISVAGTKTGTANCIVSSPPAVATSPRVCNVPPPSPSHVPPPASPPPRPPSLSSNSSDSELTPPSPSLEERIKSLDEKYEKWSGSRTFTHTPGSETIIKLDATPTERVRVRHKLLDIDINEVKPSDILKSVLARVSVFDADLKRLENIGEKYEPKEFMQLPRTTLPQFVSCQSPLTAVTSFPSSLMPSILPKLPPTPTIVNTHPSIPALPKVFTNTVAVNQIVPQNTSTAPTEASQPKSPHTPLTPHTPTIPLLLTLPLPLSKASPAAALPPTPPATKVPPKTNCVSPRNAGSSVPSYNKGLQYPFPSHPPMMSSGSSPTLPVSTATVTCTVLPLSTETRTTSTKNTTTTTKFTTTTSTVMSESPKNVKGILSKSSSLVERASGSQNRILNKSVSVPGSTNSGTVVSSTAMCDKPSASGNIPCSDKIGTDSASINKHSVSACGNFEQCNSTVNKSYPPKTNSKKDDKSYKSSEKSVNNKCESIGVNNSNRTDKKDKLKIRNRDIINLDRQKPKEMEKQESGKNSDYNIEKDKIDNNKCDKVEDDKERRREDKQEREKKEREERKEEDRRNKQLEKERKREEKERKEREELLEKERIENEKTDKENERRREREDKERREKEGQIEKERLEKERLDRVEKERLDKELQDRLEREKQERLERERQERIEKEKQERLEKERRERKEKEENERQERERKDREQKEKERADLEIFEKEKKEKDRLEKLEREKEWLEKLDRDRLEEKREKHSERRKDREEKEEARERRREEKRSERENIDNHEIIIKEKRKDRDDHSIDKSHKHRHRENHNNIDGQKKERDDAIESSRNRHRETNLDRYIHNSKENHSSHLEHLKEKHTIADIDKSIVNNDTVKIEKQKSMECRDRQSTESKRRDRNTSSGSSPASIGCKRRMSSQDSLELNTEDTKRSKINHEHRKVIDRRDSKEPHPGRTSTDRPRHKHKNDFKQLENKIREDKRHNKESEEQRNKHLEDRVRKDEDRKKEKDRDRDKESDRHKENKIKSDIAEKHDKNDKQKVKKSSRDSEIQKCTLKENKIDIKLDSSLKCVTVSKESTLDKDFLARLELRSSEEDERQRAQRKEMKEQKRQQQLQQIQELQLQQQKTMQQEGYLKQDEERTKCEEIRKKEKEKRLSSERKSRDDCSTTPKSSDNCRKNIRKVTTSSDTSDSDEQKKHSIFDIVDEGPPYISMYDKVKARSCKNMQKQEEEKRQEKIKAKFSQLKQSRAKREEKKRSTSWDEDSDSDQDRQDHINKQGKIRSNKHIITSSSEDDHSNCQKRRDTFTDSDRDSDRLRMNRDRIAMLCDGDSSDGEPKKIMSRKNSRSRIASDTSDDEDMRKQLKKIKTEILSDEMDLGFADSEDKPDKSYNKKSNMSEIKIEKNDLNFCSDEKIYKKEKRSKNHEKIKFITDSSDDEKHNHLLQIKIENVNVKTENEFKSEKKKEPDKENAISSKFTDRMAMLCDVSSEGEPNVPQLCDSKKDLFSSTDKLSPESRRKHKKKQKRQKSIHVQNDVKSVNKSYDDIRIDSIDSDTAEGADVKYKHVNSERKKHSSKKDKKRDKIKDDFEKDRSRDDKIKSKKLKKSNKSEIGIIKQDSVSNSSLKREEKIQDIFGSLSDDDSEPSQNKDNTIMNHTNHNSMLPTAKSTFFDRIVGKLQVSMVYGSDSDSIPNIDLIPQQHAKIEISEKDRLKEESRKRKEKKRKDREKKILKDDENSVDLVEAGRALEAKLMDDSPTDNEKYSSNSKESIKQEYPGSELKTVTPIDVDVFRFTDGDESLESAAAIEKKEMHDQAKKEAKEKRKKKKKNKEDRLNRKEHHHHHHNEKSHERNHDKNLISSPDKIKRDSIIPTTEIPKPIIAEMKPPLQSPSLPCITDSPPREQSISCLNLSPLTARESIISPIPKTPTSTKPKENKRKSDKFIPGFGLEMDDKIHETAVKSICDFTASAPEKSVLERLSEPEPIKTTKVEGKVEDKPRVIISQEETEDAVAALLGESFGRPDFECYNNEEPSTLTESIDREHIETIPNIPEDEAEEMRQAVQSLNPGDLDTKPDTPQSENDLQIDTDTDEGGDDYSSRYDNPPKTPDTIDLSQPPKTPDIPATYFTQNTLAVAKPVITTSAASSEKLNPAEIAMLTPTLPPPLTVPSTINNFPSVITKSIVNQPVIDVPTEPTNVNAMPSLDIIVSSPIVISKSWNHGTQPADHKMKDHRYIVDQNIPDISSTERDYNIPASATIIQVTSGPRPLNVIAQNRPLLNYSVPSRMAQPQYSVKIVPPPRLSGSFNMQPPTIKIPDHQNNFSIYQNSHGSMISPKMAHEPRLLSPKIHIQEYNSMEHSPRSNLAGVPIGVQPQNILSPTGIHRQQAMHFRSQAPQSVVSTQMATNPSNRILLSPVKQNTVGGSLGSNVILNRMPMTPILAPISKPLHKSNTLLPQPNIALSSISNQNFSPQSSSMHQHQQNTILSPQTKPGFIQEHQGIRMAYPTTPTMPYGTVLTQANMGTTGGSNPMKMIMHSSIPISTVHSTITPSPTIPISTTAAQKHVSLSSVQPKSVIETMPTSMHSEMNTTVSTSEGYVRSEFLVQRANVSQITKQNNPDYVNNKIIAPLQLPIRPTEEHPPNKNIIQQIPISIPSLEDAPQMRVQPNVENEKPSPVELHLVSKTPVLLSPSTSAPSSLPVTTTIENLSFEEKIKSNIEEEVLVIDNQPNQPNHGSITKVIESNIIQQENENKPIVCNTEIKNIAVIETIENTVNIKNIETTSVIKEIDQKLTSLKEEIAENNEIKDVKDLKYIKENNELQDSKDTKDIKNINTIDINTIIHSDSKPFILNKENLILATDILGNKDEHLDSKEDSDYWSAKEVNIESVIKKVDALCSAEELSEGSDVGKDDWFDHESKSVDDCKIESGSEKMDQICEKLDTFEHTDENMKTESEDFDEGVENCEGVKEPTGRTNSKRGRMRGRKSQTKVDQVRQNAQTRRGKGAGRRGRGSRGRGNDRRSRTQELSGDVYDFHEDSGEDIKADATRPRLILTIKSPAPNQGISTTPTSSTTVTATATVAQPKGQQTTLVTSSSTTAETKEEFAHPTANTRKSRRLQERDGSRNTVDDVIEDVIRNNGVNNKNGTPSTTPRRSTRQNIGSKTPGSDKTLPNTIEVRKSPRSKDRRKDRTTSETSIDSSDEKFNKIDNKPPLLSGSPECVLNEKSEANSPCRIISTHTVISSNLETTETSVQVPVVDKTNPVIPNMPLRSLNKQIISPKSIIEGGIENMELTLIDPVTGELTVMRQSKEGQYVPVPGVYNPKYLIKHTQSEPSTPVTSVTSLVTAVPPTTITTVGPTAVTPTVTTIAMQSVVNKMTINSTQIQPPSISNPKPLTLKSHVLSNLSKPIEQTIVNSATTNTTSAQRISSIDLPVTTVANSVQQMGSSVINKSVTTSLTTSAQQVQNCSQQKPLHIIPSSTSHNISLNTSGSSTQSIATGQLSPRLQQSLASKTQNIHPQNAIIKPGTLPAQNTPPIVQKQYVVTSKQPTTVQIQKPVTNMTSQQSLNMKHQMLNSQIQQQHTKPVSSHTGMAKSHNTPTVVTSKGVLGAHGQHQILTGAVASPPLKPHMIGQQPIVTGASSSRAAIPTISPQGQVTVGPVGPVGPVGSVGPVARGQILQAGMPVPAYEANLHGEISGNFSMSRSQSPPPAHQQASLITPGEPINHFPNGLIRGAPRTHPQYVMYHQQQFFRAQQDGITSGTRIPFMTRTPMLPGGVESLQEVPELDRDHEESMPSNPPMELRRPTGSVPNLASRTVAAVPHSLQSPRDRTTDSPQVAQVYHGARISHPHFTATPGSRFYDPSMAAIGTEPPPAHRCHNSTIHLASMSPGMQTNQPSNLSHQINNPNSQLGVHPTIMIHKGPPHMSIIPSLQDRDSRDQRERLHHHHHQSVISSQTHQSPISNLTISNHGNMAPGNVSQSVSSPTGRSMQTTSPSTEDSRAEEYYNLMNKHPVVWQGVLALKNDHAAVQMHFVYGNPDIAFTALPPYGEGIITTPLRIAQRMRLEQTQIEGVARKMQAGNEHCVLLALPCGLDHVDVLQQSSNLTAGFITYLQQKQAAGIINIASPGSQNPAFVVHIFPSCDFAYNHLLENAPILLRRVAHLAYLFIVIATV